jgi:elongation factor Ts
MERNLNMEITAEMVKGLRDKTGAGMMDCKKALQETNGDFETAVDMLRQKGIAVAAKRESKVACEGIISSYQNDTAQVGALVELNCETDFVARTDEFQAIGKEITMLVADKNPACIDCLQSLEMPKKGNRTVADVITELIGKLGEKTSVGRFMRYAVSGKGVISTYIHTGNKIGVMVELNCETDGVVSNNEFQNLARDIAMQIAWSNPAYKSRDEISDDVVQREREVHRQWAINEGKPEAAINKIVDGRMDNFFSSNCLLDLPFIRDADITVSELIAETAGKLDEKISVGRFVRFRVGEAGQEE